MWSTRHNGPRTAIKDARKIALALEGVSEVDHFARPAFRTKKRIFAVIRPDGLWLHLPIERKEFLFGAAPRAFVRYMWGKTPQLLVQLKAVKVPELKALLREAWEGAAVKKRISSAKNR